MISAIFSKIYTYYFITTVA